MSEVFRFLRQNENLIYLMLGGVAFIYVLRLLSAWKDWKGVNFGLEREMVQRKISSAFAILVLCFLFAISEFILVSFVAPVTANIQTYVTPTIDLIATSSIQPESGNSLTRLSELPDLIPTPTKSINLNGCVENRLEWLYPNSGDKITGTVTLEGTVNYENMGYYKYEYSEVGSDIWNPIAAGDTRIVEGALGGPWNTDQLIPGEYRLRLVATDNNDNPFPACEISVTILPTEE